MRLVVGLVVFLAATLLAACGESSGNRLSLSATGGAPSASAAAATSSSASVAGAASPGFPSPEGSLRIDRVRIVVGSVEFLPGAYGTPTTPEVFPGPFVVDLAGRTLDAGGLVEVASLESARGSYGGVRIGIRPLAASEAGRHGDLVGASARIDGTVGGDPFSFTTDLSATIDRPGRFEWEEEDMNVTLDLAPARWFLEGGAPLDPRDPVAAAAIERRIVEALAVFADHDRNGGDDEGEGHRFDEGWRGE